MNIAEKRSAIQFAQMRQLFSASNVSLVSSMLLAAILAYAQREVIDLSVIAAWFSLIVISSLSRAALVIAYQHSAAGKVAAMQGWLARFRLLVLLAGVAWGSAGFLLFPANHPQYQLVLVVILVGLTAGAIVSFSADLFCAAVFLVSALAPLTFRLFVEGGSLPVAIGAALILYLGFMGMNLRRLNRNISENIELHLEAAAREATLREEVTKGEAASEEIKNLAFYDPLTHLPNRRLLLDRLKQAFASSARSGKKGALLFIDLDNFKRLNDTLGHGIGDMLLQQVADRLASCIRKGDTVARLGGDEFVVILEDLSEQNLEAAAQTEAIGEKILATLNKPYRLATHEYHGTPSIGATLFGEQQEGIDETLQHADMAMYQAKAAGRNALRFFDPQMQAMITARVALEAGLREALANDQFLLYYQVQVTGEGKIAGAEALVRWQHPQRGMVSPAEFIPLAEETGLILPLGDWVLNTACVQLAIWATWTEMAHLTVSVNVSARQFQQDDFVAQVLDVLERTGANPQRLKLELTESMLISNVENVIAKMAALKARGVGFALDDFGTGYSSLAYLSRLPLDQLKIDRSFVADIESNESAVVICAATISLAHSLNLKVVAEGVETGTQSYFLSSVHRCDFSQGYLFSRPLPLGEFEEFVKRCPRRLKM